MADLNYTSVEVSTEKLRNDINEMNICLENNKRAIEDIFLSVEHLNTMWEGNANAAFNEKFKADYNEMKSYFLSVERFIKKVSEDCSSYEECERSVNEFVESLQV